MEDRKIKIGVPKGSLQEHTLKIFQSADFNVQVLPKSYILKFDDPEIEAYLIRSQEIPKYVEEGKLDIGISGADWITETRAKVIEVCDLKYAKQRIKKVKWVLAVSNDSKIKSVKDLAGKTVSSEVVNIAKDYLKKKRIKAKVEFSWGATEVKPSRFADAIIDLIETGSALKAHNLKVLDTVFESSTKLVANKKSWKDEWKKRKIEDLSTLLKGAVDSERISGFFMHVPTAILEKALKLLPISKKPTITRVAGTNLSDVFFTVGDAEARELIPRLKKLGCQAMVEFPLNKIVP